MHRRVRIDLGDGIAHPGTGAFAQSGLFVYGALEDVYITGFGNDINGPVFAVNDIDTVTVTDGARIVGYNSWYGSQGERVRGSYYMATTIGVTPFFNEFQVMVELVIQVWAT